MKKTFILGLIAAVLGFTACSSKEDSSLSENTKNKGMVQLAVTRAAIDHTEATWQFGFKSGDKIEVTNSANDKYTFENKGEQFRCQDAKPTSKAETWYAFYPSTEVNLANQAGTFEGAASLYLLAGQTVEPTTGENGLNIEMKPQCAILVIDNQKGTIDINVKANVGGNKMWAAVVLADSDGIGVSYQREKVSLLTATETGTYYVVVPAGKQIAIKDGDTEIKATGTSGLEAGKYYNLTIAAGPDYVEIGGKKWATKNLGATTVAGSLATCAGDYYQWGSLNTLYESISWSGTTPTITWKSGKESGFEDGNREYTTNADLPAANDVVTQTLGGGWRMPTKADFEALHNACTGSTSSSTPTPLSAAPTAGGVYWLAADQAILSEYTGVAGILYVDQTDTSKRVFFPAAGIADGTILLFGGTFGSYWSSSLFTDDPDNAYYLLFNSSAVGPSNYYGRRCGFTVRPVKD